MRDVAVYSNPVVEPGCCSKCGSQDKDWFVDIGFDTIMNRSNLIKMDSEETPYVDIPIWLDGIIYLCCDCINNLLSDVDRRFSEFRTNHNVEVEFYGSSITPDSSGANQDDPGIESNDSDPDSGAENSESDSRGPFSFVQ